MWASIFCRISRILTSKPRTPSCSKTGVKHRELQIKTLGRIKLGSQPVGIKHYWPNMWTLGPLSTRMAHTGGVVTSPISGLV